MYGSPLPSTPPSPKKGSAAAATDPLSADDLLDNPWHYDCVVSPRLLASDSAPSPNSLSGRSAPAPGRPPPFSGLSLLRQRSAPPPSYKRADDFPHQQFAPSSPPSAHSPSVSKPAELERSLTVQASSAYVSLASFIQNADKSSYGSSAADAGGLDFLSRRSFVKSLKPVPSKCREKGTKARIRADPSRIRSGSGCLAVD